MNRNWIKSIRNNSRLKASSREDVLSFKKVINNWELLRLLLNVCVFACLYVLFFGQLWIAVDFVGRCGLLLTLGSLWIVAGCFGLLWIVAGRCVLLWMVVDHCGLLRVIPCFSKYENMTNLSLSVISKEDVLNTSKEIQERVTFQLK